MPSPLPFTRSVWVSYSGKDQAFVQCLTDRIADKYRVLDNSQPQTEAQEGYTPFRLMNYMRSESTSEPLSEEERATHPTSMYLKAGESVKDLVEVIAGTLRRIVVISPTYLQSEHCMWELCSCLSQASKLPCCILKEFTSFSSVTERRQYSFMDDSNEYSLLQALVYIYKKHVKTMHQCFHLNDPDENLEAFFAKALDKLRDANYFSPTNTQIEESAEFIHGYVSSFTLKEIEKEFEDYLSTLYRNWSLEDYAKLCLEGTKNTPLFDTNGFEQNHFLSPDRKELKVLVDQLETNCHLEAVSKDKVNIALKGFAALLALRCINPEWVTEMKMSSLSGARLRLAVRYKQKQRVFVSQLAACAIQRVALELEPDRGNAPTVHGLLMIKPQCGTPEQREAKQQQQTRQLMLELVMRVMSYSASEAKLFMKNDDWKQTLRARIYIQHLDDQDLLTIARIYVDRDSFSTELSEAWEQAADHLVEEINAGAESNRRVRIGTLQVSSRDEGNMIEFFRDHDLWLANIDRILEQCQ